MISNVSLSSGYLDMVTYGHIGDIARERVKDIFVQHASNEWRPVQMLSHSRSCSHFWVCLFFIYLSISTKLCGIDNYYSIVSPNFAEIIYVFFFFTRKVPGETLVGTTRNSFLHV